MTFSAQEKLRALLREIALRKRVYPGRVLTHRMRQAEADRQIAIMEAIAADYADEEPRHAPQEAQLTLF